MDFLICILFLPSPTHLSTPTVHLSGGASLQRILSICRLIMWFVKLFSGRASLSCCSLRVAVCISVLECMHKRTSLFAHQWRRAHSHSIPPTWPSHFSQLQLASMPHVITVLLFKIRKAIILNLPTSKMFFRCAVCTTLPLYTFI